MKASKKGQAPTACSCERMMSYDLGASPYFDFPRSAMPKLSRRHALAAGWFYMIEPSANALRLILNKSFDKSRPDWQGRNAVWNTQCHSLVSYHLPRGLELGPRLTELRPRLTAKRKMGLAPPRIRPIPRKNSAGGACTISPRHSSTRQKRDRHRRLAHEGVKKGTGTDGLLMRKNDVLRSRSQSLF
jgi:hypothetical protein